MQVPTPITKLEPWDLRIESHRRAVSESTSLSGTVGKPFDLWTGHAIYNNALRRVLKGDHSQVVTILRDPVDRFISAWFYFDRGDLSSLISFVDHAYSTGVSNAGSGEFGLGASFNSMCLQFSVLENYSNDVFENIRNGTWIVLLLEHLNEGLMMMQREFEWDLSDILYIPKKVNPQKKTTMMRDTIPTSTKRKLRALNSCDQKLYEVALESHFRRRDRKNPPKIHEIEHFEAILKNVQKTCLNDISTRIRLNNYDISCNSLYFDDRDLVLQNALWRQLLPEHAHDPFQVDTSYYELRSAMESRGMIRKDGTATYAYHVDL